MSCICNNEYDCICDDTYYLDEDDEPQFDWAVFAAKVRDDFKAAMWNIGKAGLEWPDRRGPIWWELLTPPPPGLNIREEKDWERYDLRSFGSRAPLLLSSKIYLELPDPPGQANLRWDHGNRLSRWPVQSYWVKRDTDTSPVYLTSVLASKPPDFGWWMPSLRNPW